MRQITEKDLKTIMRNTEQRVFTIEWGEYIRSCINKLMNCDSLGEEVVPPKLYSFELFRNHVIPAYEFLEIYDVDIHVSLKNTSTYDVKYVNCKNNYAKFRDTISSHLGIYDEIEIRFVEKDENFASTSTYARNGVRCWAVGSVDFIKDCMVYAAAYNAKILEISETK